MTVHQIALDILSGKYDTELDYLTRICNERKKELAPTVRDFNVGDRVRYNEQTNPKYLIGAVGVIQRINRTKVVVKLDQPVGRFSGNITTPTNLIEKIPA